MPHTKPIEEQFWPNVARGSSDECWPWLRSRRPTGYGQLRRLGKNLKAHRVAWELTFGPIPDGSVVRHSCDNPPCCNPAHLLIGSQTDNLADMRERSRASGKVQIGASNPASKLVPEQVIDLRARFAGGESMRSLARSFRLNKKTVSGIVKRETWRSL